MNDGIGLAERLLGLDGFRVLEVSEGPDELVITIETTADFVGCSDCGVRAESDDRRPIAIRDLSCFGRPARLVWVKRRWRCREAASDAKTWTESSAHVDAQVVLTRRAGAEACRQVGELARPVSKVAEEFGVCWWTVMNAVVEHVTPLVDDPDRIGAVDQLGIDDTLFLAANRSHAAVYVTGLVDLEAKVVIDMVEGNAAADLRRWSAKADPGCLDGIEVVTTDLAESFRAGLSPYLDHARRTADPFHVVRAGNRCLAKVRRRVQNETLGHRGRKRDPLYRIRKLLLSGHERLDEAGHQRMLLGLRVGDPADEVLGAWLAKESVRDVYLAEDRTEAALLLNKAIAGCADDEVEEVRSLGNPGSMARRDPRASRHRCLQRPDRRAEPVREEGQACGHGFRTFEHYRLRVLLHAGGVTWPSRPRPARIRTATPHSNA